ncbi:unnamed protein product, partial [marine sediment metagenome]
TEPEKEVHLKLKYGSEGSVTVCACDEEGTPLFCGGLVIFYPDGTMRRLRGVDKGIGFQLADENRIRTEE